MLAAGMQFLVSVHLLPFFMLSYFSRAQTEEYQRIKTVKCAQLAHQEWVRDEEMAQLRDEALTSRLLARIHHPEG